MKRLLALPLGLALLASVGGTGRGQGGLPGGAQPAPGGLPGGVTAAPVHPASEFPVTPALGEWMVLAASYFGPDAPDLARQVTLELRNKHRLPAYVFNHADKERERLREEDDRRQKMYPGVPIRRRTVRVQDQCAVLLGGFEGFDHASRYLPTFRKLPLPELKLPGGRNPYDLVYAHVPDEEKKKTVVKQARVNPFQTAMVVRNPSLPSKNEAKPRYDPFWEKLNAGEEYSALKAPKPWTLIVKEYSGATLLTAPPAKSGGFLELLGLGGDRPGDRLQAAGLQAHELARVLRTPQLGFQAYVLHTRSSSLVTVGAFDGPHDPEMQRTAQRLAALRFSSAPGAAANDPIGLMAQPIPAQIPRPGE